jgi:hypothetical protein
MPNVYWRLSQATHSTASVVAPAYPPPPPRCCFKKNMRNKWHKILRKYHHQKDTLDIILSTAGLYYVCEIQYSFIKICNSAFPAPGWRGKFMVIHLFNLNTRPKLFSATHAQKAHSRPRITEHWPVFVNTNEMSRQILTTQKVDFSTICEYHHRCRHWLHDKQKSVGKSY